MKKDNSIKAMSSDNNLISSDEDGELKNHDVDSLNIKPPQLIQPYKKSHNQDAYSRRRDCRYDQEKNSGHNRRRSEGSNKSRDKESSKSRRYETNNMLSASRRSDPENWEKEFHRFHKKRRRDSLEDKNSKKIRSSSKSRSGSRHEIRAGDMSENKETHLVEKASLKRHIKEMKMKDHRELDSQNQIIYKDSEKRSERSHKHEKSKRRKDEPENKDQKSASKQNYDLHNEARELVAKALKENKQQPDRDNSSKSFKEMTDQEIQRHVLKDLDREMARRKKNAHLNSEQKKKIEKEQILHSSKKNPHLSKMELSDSESSTEDSDDSSSESSSTDSDSSSDSESSTDSEDTSTDESNSTSTSSDESNHKEIKSSRLRRESPKILKKKSSKNLSPVPNNPSPDAYRNERNGVDNEVFSNISKKDANSGDDLNTPSTLSADQLVKSDKSNTSSPVIVESNSVDTETKNDEKKSELELIEDLPAYYPALQGCRGIQEYQILKSVAEGTYGVVYRGIDKRTRETVALKRLKMEKEKDGFPKTSLREINTLLKAQHPNIVTVREIVVGNDMDKIFIVMDYVENDLMSFMKKMKEKKEKFSPERAKSLMKQLLKAVAHMHDNWIIHRDLKPSNLLVSSDGVLKVGDFGMAREYGSPLKSYTSLVVTLWYRAPELLLGCKQYSTSVDVWSVGCIFAEILTMEALFPGKSEAELIKMIFKELGTPNDKIWPGYSDLPLVSKISVGNYPANKLRQRFSLFTQSTFDLVTKFFTYNPATRISAEDALKHNYFEQEFTPSQGIRFSEFLNSSQEDASAPVGGGFFLK